MRVMLLALLHQQFHQLHTFLFAMCSNVVDKELQVLLQNC